MSTLENLFRYAKASKVHARENFTTEALAGCIRADAQPFLECLVARSLWRDEMVVEDVITQMPVAGVGYIDLVLVGTDGAGSSTELWGELKLDSGESGDQIDRYLGHLQTIGQSHRNPTLFTLGRSPLPLRVNVPHLTWHEVGRKAAAAVSPQWEDFVEYMVENGMTGSYDESPTAAEIASAAAFDGLVGKVARLIELTFEEANRRGIGDVAWPREPVRKEIVGRFAAKGNLLAAAYLPGPARTSWVVLGIAPDAEVATLSVWVETWPSQTDLQREIHELALKTLSTEWERRHGHWGGLRIGVPWRPDTPHQTAVEWLVARLEQLADAGILAAMQAASAGQQPPAEATQSPIGS